MLTPAEQAANNTVMIRFVRSKTDRLVLRLRDATTPPSRAA